MHDKQTARHEAKVRHYDYLAARRRACLFAAATLPLRNVACSGASAVPACARPCHTVLADSLATRVRLTGPPWCALPVCSLPALRLP